MILLKNSSQALLGLTLIAVSTLAACTAEGVEDVNERTDTQPVTKAAAEPTGRPVTQEEIAMITRSPVFAAAQEIVTEDGQQVDLARGLVYTNADVGSSTPGTETRFSVSVASGGAASAYPDLVFQQIDRNPDNCYFIDPNTPPDKPTVAGAITDDGADIGGDKTTNSICWFGPPWSSWTFVSQTCGFRLLCIFHQFKARFRTETRTRNCTLPKRIMTETRTVFAGCGC